MSNRREFPRAVKVAIIKRSTRDGFQFCEKCGGPANGGEVDHKNPDGMQVDKSAVLTADEGWFLCRICHVEKSKGDVEAIARAKRVESAHLGAKPAPAKPIESPGFPPPAKGKRASRPPVPGATGIARRYGISK